MLSSEISLSAQRSVIEFESAFLSRLDRVNDWRERAADAGYNAAQLAKSCEISPSQLRRYFLMRFGTSPKKWMMEVRLRRSLSLIFETSKSLKEIAAALDYPSQAGLSHQFKRRFGFKPSEAAIHLRGIRTNETTPVQRSA